MFNEQLSEQEDFDDNSSNKESLDNNLSIRNDMNCERQTDDSIDKIRDTRNINIRITKNQSNYIKKLIDSQKLNALKNNNKGDRNLALLNNDIST